MACCVILSMNSLFENVLQRGQRQQGRANCMFSCMGCALSLSLSLSYFSSCCLSSVSSVLDSFHAICPNECGLLPVYLCRPSLEVDEDMTPSHIPKTILDAIWFGGHAQHILRQLVDHGLQSNKVTRCFLRTMDNAGFLFLYFLFFLSLFSRSVCSLCLILYEALLPSKRKLNLHLR